jgi:hypothetical protein
MVIRFNSKTSANEPLVSSDDLIGQQIRELAARFANSPQQLLEYLQALVQTLDGQIQERIGFQGPDNFNRFGSFPLSYAWRSEDSFDYSSFANVASITYEAWQVARRISADLDSFDGSKLEPLVQLFKKIGTGSGLPAGSTVYAEIPTLFFPFQAEVVRLEVYLSLKPAIGTTQPTAAEPDETSALPSVERLDGTSSLEVTQIADGSTTVKLPFGLKLCDVPQSLKRDGYDKPVTIRNDDYWKLMEALMHVAPNAIPESKLKHLFSSTSDRQNAPKKLRDIIHDLGLTVKNWTLIELDT